MLVYDNDKVCERVISISISSLLCITSGLHHLNSLLDCIAISSSIESIDVSALSFCKRISGQRRKNRGCT